MARNSLATIKSRVRWAASPVMEAWASRVCARLTKSADMPVFNSWSAAGPFIVSSALAMAGFSDSGARGGMLERAGVRVPSVAFEERGWGRGGPEGGLGGALLVNGFGGWEVGGVGCRGAGAARGACCDE